ncbi:hypothetical protein [Azospirillum doebereinerae]
MSSCLLGSGIDAAGLACIAHEHGCWSAFTATQEENERQSLLLQ